MLYDVEVTSRGGWATDTTTNRLVRAVRRCLELARRGQRSRVIDAQGRQVAP